MESSPTKESPYENISDREENNKLIEKKEDFETKVIEKRQENTVAVVTNYIVMTYSGIRRFKCSQCPVTFRRKSDFKRHFQIMHERKKPYSV